MTNSAFGKGRLLGAFLAAALGAGCSGAGEVTTGETNDDEGYINGDLLHSLAIGQDHVLEFYEFRDGQLAVRESQPAGAKGVLDGMNGSLTLSQMFRRAEPELAVPQAIAEAEERAARAEAALSAVDRRAIAEASTLDGEREAFGPATEAEPMETRAIACSGDILADNWGDQWFRTNHCNITCRPEDWLEFSGCDTNWGWAQKSAAAQDWLHWRQFEGDHAVAGRIRAWSDGGGYAAPVGHFDHKIQPRKMETWSYPSSISFTRNHFRGDSPCGHLDTNRIRCD